MEDISLVEASSGEVIWSDSVVAFSPRTPLQELGDIRAHPVHDGGVVYAVSQAGQIAAFNSRSGLLLWINRLVALRCHGLRVNLCF